jgi:hypothetical protein
VNEQEFARVFSHLAPRGREWNAGDSGKLRQEIARLSEALEWYPRRGDTWDVLAEKISALEKKANELDDRGTDDRNPMAVSITTFLEKLSQGENGDAHK